MQAGSARDEFAISALKPTAPSCQSCGWRAAILRLPNDSVEFEHRNLMPRDKVASHRRLARSRVTEDYDSHPVGLHTP